MKAMPSFTTTTQRLLLMALALCCMFFGTACSVNPATNDFDFVTMSEATEIQKGKELHEKILASMPIYEDEKLQQYINDIGQKLAAKSDRPSLEYHFTIIDKPDINAFALPGGYIYINRGLLAYLNSEAQVAAVLAHEISHVTARHAVRQDGAKKGAGSLSILATIATGSSSVGEATDLWSGAAVSGYGRDLELEADRFGAQYLYNSGYDPKAMIEVIGVLKDQERFSRYRAREEGKKSKSYHGVFSSHPRNDQRLQEVVNKAGSLPDDATKTNTKEFRKHLEGVIYGQNYDLKKAAKASEINRYTHKRLGFNIIFPKGWKVENRRSDIIAMPEDKSAEIVLQIDALKKPTAPADYIHNQLKVDPLAESQPLKQYKLIGHTGLVVEPDKPNTQRVAVLLQGARVYIIRANELTVKDDFDADKIFMDTISSFRPVRPSSKKQTKRRSKTIHYVKANEHTTFASLAKFTRIGKYGEQQLRLINGYYPRGEPEVGEWIKIIK